MLKSKQFYKTLPNVVDMEVLDRWYDQSYESFRHVGTPYISDCHRVLFCNWIRDVIYPGL